MTDLTWPGAVHLCARTTRVCLFLPAELAASWQRWICTPDRPMRLLSLQDLTQHDFPLPTLGPRLVEIHEEVVHGRGFQLIKGLPVQRYSPQEVMTIYW